MLRSLLAKKGKFDPRRRRMPPRIPTREDLDKLVDLGVIDCLEPEAPFISRTTPLVTAGSCFAYNVARYLRESNYNVHAFDVFDRLFTPPAIRTFVERGLRDGEPATILNEHWHNLGQDTLDTSRRLLTEGGVFIATYGLSVVWINRMTGEMIHDPTVKLPKSALIAPDPTKYEMVQMPVPDIVECMTDTINAVRAINPSTKVIFTLSPYIMAYSGMDYPVLVADCLSKCSLRVALHEVLSLRLKDVYYFPSFELLRWLSPLADAAWGADETITHIKEPWIDYTMYKFRQYYCVEKEPPLLPPEITTRPF